MLLGFTGAAGLVGAGYLMVPTRSGAGESALLDPVEAHRQALSGKILLIDIRRPDEWQRTGLGQGAVPIDMRRKDFVDALLAEQMK